MFKWILLSLFTLNSLALEITIDSAKENFSRYSTLNIKNDKNFICQEIKNDFNIVTDIICAFSQKPSTTLDKVQNDFFKVDSFIQKNTFFIKIKPIKKIKLIANIFDLTKDNTIFNAKIEKAMSWTIIGYKEELPLINNKQKPDISINFPYYWDKAALPYVGSLDLKGNPVHIEKVTDVTDYLRVKKLYKKKNYELCLEIAEDILDEYPDTLFKAELFYYKIKIYSKLKDYDNVVDNSKIYLQEYSANENIAEILSLLSQAYVKIGMTSDAEYFFDRLFSEHSDSVFSEWGKIYQGEMLEASGGVSKAIALYKDVLYKTKSIDVGATAAYNLAKIQLDTSTKESSKYIDKLVLVKPSYFYENYKVSKEMMESFAEYQFYLTAAKIVGSMLDSINPTYDEYEIFLNKKALWLALSNNKSEALIALNRYLKEFPDGDHIDKVQTAKDALFFDTKENNTTIRLIEYDKLIEEYQNDTIGTRAIYEKAKLLLDLEKNKELLEMKESVLSLDMDIYEDKEELIVNAAIGLMKSSLKDKECKKVLTISHDYNITLSDEWDDGVYECAMKGADYVLGKKTAYKNLKNSDLDERKKWLYRYIKVDFATGNYSEVISASKELVVLIEDNKNSMYKDIYRILFDTYERLEQSDEMLKAMIKVEDTFGLTYLDIERYISVMSVGNERNDDNIVINYATKVMNIQEKSNSSAQSPYVEFTLYQALINKEDYRKALEVIKHLNDVELSKKDRARQKYLLGTVLSKLWRNDEADKAYDMAIEADPKSAWAKLAQSAKEI